LTGANYLQGWRARASGREIDVEVREDTAFQVARAGAVAFDGGLQQTVRKFAGNGNRIEGRDGMEQVHGEYPVQ
jgi:hypothetical protein